MGSGQLFCDLLKPAYGLMKAGFSILSRGCVRTSGGACGLPTVNNLWRINLPGDQLDRAPENLVDSPEKGQ